MGQLTQAQKSSPAHGGCGRAFLRLADLLILGAADQVIQTHLVIICQRNQMMNRDFARAIFILTVLLLCCAQQFGYIRLFLICVFSQIAESRIIRHSQHLCDKNSLHLIGHVACTSKRAYTIRRGDWGWKILFVNIVFTLVRIMSSLGASLFPRAMLCRLL